MTILFLLPRAFFARRITCSATPAWVVLAALLACTSPVLAQDDGDSGWKSAKPKPKATPAPATQPAPKPTTGDKDKIKNEGRELFNKPLPGSGDGGAGDAAGWAIVLVAIRGDERDQVAARTLAQVRAEGGLPEAYLTKRRDAIIVAVGDFPTPDDPRAKAELSRVQNLEINGNKPYASAMLAPPLDFKMTGSMPQFNLLRAKELSGGSAIYTLQVAVYGRMDLPHPSQEDLAEPRKAAEQAAAKLRQEGEQAWYYHGQTMSMVCIGSFDQTDFDPQTPNFKSPKLRDIQKRYPYNLYNGAGINVKRKGDRVEAKQPSSLVEIPKS